MVAARRVQSLWWSSVLSSHVAGCRCPGGREGHLRQCAGSFELFSAGLSGAVPVPGGDAASQDALHSTTVWGFLSSDQLSSGHLRKKRRWWAFLTTDHERIVQVRSSVMFPPLLLTRSTGVPSMEMWGCSLVRLLKSTISSLVLLMLWHQLVRVCTSSL